MESIKDVTVRNITSAVSTGQLKIDASQMTALLALISSSVDEGYHKSHRTFMKSVDATLSELTVNESFPPVDTKKN